MIKTTKIPKCKICKSEYVPRNSFQKTCLNIDCALSWIDQNKVKVEKTAKKIVKDDIKAMKSRQMSHGNYESILQRHINKLSRLIHKGHPCISCGNTFSNGQKVYAGHRWNVGSNNTWRFHLSNLENQCFSCNDKKSGNIDGYDKGLLEKYGEEYAEYVKYNMKKRFPIIKLTIDELQEAIKITLSCIKEMEGIDETYSSEEVIKIKDYYNGIIGIYR